MKITNTQPPGNPIQLPENDPKGQIDAILAGIGKVSCEMTAFDAVYIISAIQTALAHPGMLDITSMPVKRIEDFAKALGEGVGRHPDLKRMLDAGWEGVELVRQSQKQIRENNRLAAERADELVFPGTVKDLKALAKNAGITGYSRLKKDSLIEKLKSLPPSQLIEAFENWNS